ncbi:MAG: hypothetical protein YPKNTGVA_002349, partial [Candidatus Fervidibacter sp.]
NLPAHHKLSQISGSKSSQMGALNPIGICSSPAL